MQKSEDAVIPMQLNSNNERLKYSVGNDERVLQMPNLKALPIFCEEVICFFDTVSKLITKNPALREFPDVVTFGFWCRKASIMVMKKRYGHMHHSYGRGLAFHITPSNVPVNFAYSLAAGLLSGNSNIIRIPSKEFEQVTILCRIIKEALEEHAILQPYICCVQYGHDYRITDYFSSLCDARVIWGGDQTIQTIRKSGMKLRGTEVVFADRFSIVIIDSHAYWKMEEKEKSKIARDFFNDTYLTDQNACTSPKFVIWLGGEGKEAEEAQQCFWDRLKAYAKEHYSLQPVQAVNKLAWVYQLGAVTEKAHVLDYDDNLIVRIHLDELKKDFVDYCGNSGYFFEYNARGIEEILPICTDKCQTVSYLGVDVGLIEAFIEENVPSGIDRVVPLGRTMDFSLVWDGYDLIQALSREVCFY